MLQRCFDFKHFKDNGLITHDTVIEKLVHKNFGSYTLKRQTLAKQNLSIIISATFELANKIGFAKMSMRDLSSASGISLGGLYTYVEGKEALALMVVESLNELALDWLPTFIDEQLNKEEKLERLIRGHIYLSELLRPWFYFSFMENKNLPEKNKAKAREAEHNFQCLLEEIYSGNSLMASHIMALIQDWHVKHWKHKKRSIDVFADSVNNIAKTMIYIT